MPPIVPFFPYEQVRPIQEEYITGVAQAVTQKRVLIAHAPTGLGKTAAALAPAVQYAQENSKVVFFLTNRHTQHTIAIETLQQMKERHHLNITCVDLIGKKWMCNQDVDALSSSEFNEFCRLVVDKKECPHYLHFKDEQQLTPQAKRLVSRLLKKGVLPNEELILAGRQEQICSYELATKLTEKATVVIADYHYLFNPFIRQKILARMGRDLSEVIIIVDEAHNLPSRVTDLLSSTLSTITLTYAEQEARKNDYGRIGGRLERLLTFLKSQGTNAPEQKVDKENLLSFISQWTDYDSFIEELQEIADDIRRRQRKSFIGGVASFLEQWPAEQAGLVRFISHYSGRYEPVTTLHYACLDPSIITTEVFDQCHSAILMSGTLRPTAFYRDILGITDPLEREYLSPFPPENKLSIIIPETSTKFTRRNPEMYQQIAKTCQNVNQAIPGNLAIFFPSYDVLRAVLPCFTSNEKKLFIEKQDWSAEEKEQFIAEFKDQQHPGGVLLAVAGANFAEGIDYPGKMLNGVVIVGLPLSTPNLKTRETIAYYDQKFGKGWDYGYLFPALNKCFQSAGRCIRSAEDRGVIIYLDERFAWKQYFQWFDKEQLIVTKDWKRLVGVFFQEQLSTPSTVTKR